MQVFVGALSPHYEALSVEASKQTSSEEIVNCITEKLSLADGTGGPYELAEVNTLLLWVYWHVLVVAVKYKRCL